MTGGTVVWRQSARYQGADAPRVVCPASAAINIGGRFGQRPAFLPEGGLRLDRRQLKS